MSLRRIIRNRFVDHLPKSLRLFIEQQYAGRYLSREKRLFKALCGTDKTSVDVGANQGDMALFLRCYSSQVHAFEPVPAMASRLRHRFRECNVKVYECALGASTKEDTIRIPSFGHQDYTTRASLVDLGNIKARGQALTEFHELTVQVRCLDDFDLGRVGFIKIDVEGYELEVLRGAMKTIQKHKPSLYVEIEQRRHPGRPIEGVFDSIQSLGYHGWFVGRSGIFPIQDFKIAGMQDPDLEETADFVNNFIFLPTPDRPSFRL